MTTIAVPAAYSDDLAPITISFELAQSDDDLLAQGSIDFEQVTSARAVVTRPDGVVLDWALQIAAGATETEITLEHELDQSDLFDTSTRSVLGTYDVRILVTDPDGELPLGKSWLAVEAF